jgi:hypothetical protein
MIKMRNIRNKNNYLIINNIVIIISKSKNNQLVVNKIINIKNKSNWSLLLELDLARREPSNTSKHTYTHTCTQIPHGLV